MQLRLSTPHRNDSETAAVVPLAYISDVYLDLAQRLFLNSHNLLHVPIQVNRRPFERIVLD